MFNFDHVTPVSIVTSVSLDCHVRNVVDREFDRAALKLDSDTKLDAMAKEHSDKVSKLT